MPRLYFASESDARPHVTLTFAQSVDGKIAGPNKKQLALSCEQSMLMTHKLRTMHDGILVGVGTVLNDDPQLNARLLPVPPPVSDLPRPIVLDSALRTPLSSKLLRNYANNTGRQPLLLCSQDASLQNQTVLEDAGAKVIRIAASGSHLDWTIVLMHIRAAGVQRLMVEGGAAVIDSLLHQQQLINTLLITVAPITVGIHGLGYSTPLPGPDDTLWTVKDDKMYGIDNIVIWQKKRDNTYTDEI